MTCNDSETKNVKCPCCGEWFDGEYPTWEEGSEECPHCEEVFTVPAQK